MEANALAETCAGVHQTQQGSFATCQFRLLPDLLLTATRMPATRDQNLPPTPCTLSHCPISKVIPQHCEKMLPFHWPLLQRKFGTFYLDVHSVSMVNNFVTVFCIDQESKVLLITEPCQQCLHVPGCIARELLICSWWDLITLVVGNDVSWLRSSTTTDLGQKTEMDSSSQC